MTKIYLLPCLLIFSSCAIFQPEETSVTQPKLLKQSTLPPVKQSTFSDKYEFYCQMVINENGDVEKAKVLTGSGDALWDSLTAISLLTWKFSPAIQDGKPIKLTVRRKFIVMYEKPEIISLAEIQLKDNSLADSVYMALVEGANFFELALKYSISISSQKKGFLGSVDIKQYSKDISSILSKLDEEEFTKPLKFGEHYIIFKRLKRNN